MKNSLFIGLSILLLAFTTGDSNPQTPEDISPLLIGETIPGVRLQSVDDQSVSLLAEVAKKPTVLVFYGEAGALIAADS